MASSKGQVPGVLLLILTLLVTQSPRTTEASICQMKCLFRCLNGSIMAYPTCGANCLALDCKVKPSPSEDNLLQCKASCIMTTCMGPNRGTPNGKKSKQCVKYCSDGCETGYFKSLY